MATALLRGAACKCPNCGEGALFRKFLKVKDNCETCGEDLSHQRADDMPAYIVISIVGHIVIGLLLWVETNFAPDMWVHIALWFPLTIALSLGAAAAGQGHHRRPAVVPRHARLRTATGDRPCRAGARLLRAAAR